MQEGLDAWACGAASGPVVGIEILLSETIFSSLKHKRVRFDQTPVPIVSDIEKRKVTRRLHDDIAEIRVKGDAAIVVNAQTRENRFDIFLEATERSVEVEEALCGTDQILLPDTSECLKRQIEQKSFRNTGA